MNIIEKVVIGVVAVLLLTVALAWAASTSISFTGSGTSDTFTLQGDYAPGQERRFTIECDPATDTGLFRGAFAPVLTGPFEEVLQ
jgi:hypothetical protein